MKYRLGPVQDTHDSKGNFSVGFNITDHNGAPIVMLGYLDPTDAANARGLIEKAISEATLIKAALR